MRRAGLNRRKSTGMLTMNKALLRPLGAVIYRQPLLLLFPLFSALILIGVFMSVIPAEVSPAPPGLETIKELGNTMEKLAAGGLLFIYYLVAYGVVLLSNAGLVASSFPALQGKQCSLRSGFNALYHQGSKIIRWALISATMGIVLRYLGSKSKEISRFLFPSGEGRAWNVLSFFLLPAIVLEQKDIHQALHRSKELLRRTWKQPVLPTYLFGGYGVTLVSLGVLFFFYGLLFDSSLWKEIAIIWIVLAGIFLSTLGTIAKTALYVYSSTGNVPKGFSEAELKRAFLNGNDDQNEGKVCESSFVVRGRGRSKHG